MSKNLTIDEGGESRRFDGVRRLKTKLMGEDGGSCYWVPEDETQAWPTFIMNNGLHAAEDEGVYGFSEANVNVYIPSPDPDWKIIIDDIDIPHIIIEDIDIDIDDINIHVDDIDISIDDDDGTPIVDIEGVDIDGVDIDSIDIRIDPDTGIPIPHIEIPEMVIHIWTDPEDPDIIHIKEEPDGEEIILDIDDIDPANIKDLIVIDYDDEEDKWVITANDKIKIDDVDYEAGDVIKLWDEDEIVDFTMKVDQEFTVDYPDIDPDFGEDFDIELDLDNMELDMDGLDMDIDLPLLKMPDLGDELPDEIRIMHVPDKTSYKDGEAIDLDGIVVQAYKNGSVWQNKKYINGYIPAHELEYEVEQDGNVIINGIACGKTAEYLYKYENNGETFECHEYQGFTREEIENKYPDYPYPIPISPSIPEVMLTNIVWDNKQYTVFVTKNWSATNLSPIVMITKDGETIDDDIFNKGGLTVELTKNGETIGWAGHYGSNMSNYSRFNPEIVSEVLPPSSSINYTATMWNDLYEMGYSWTSSGIGGNTARLYAFIIYLLVTGETIKGTHVKLMWPRPVDSQILSASFQISVEPAEDTTSAGN